MVDVMVRTGKAEIESKSGYIGRGGGGEGERVRVMGARVYARACVHKRERESEGYIFGRLKLDITL